MSAEVLAANRAFYTAFAHGDLTAMEALWARHAPVACVHPGWNALIGRESVMASWRAVLSSGPPPVRCADPIVHRQGDMATVICAELLGDTRLIATNVFVREDDAWRIVHHHAGWIARDDEPGETDDADDGDADDGVASGGGKRILN